MDMIGNFVNIAAFGLAFVLVGLGVFLSYKILKITDLTCEASFGLGSCIYAILVIFGVSPLLAMMAAMILGYCSGAITSFLINYIKLSTIVSGIISACIIQNAIMKISMLREGTTLTKSSILGQMSATSNFILVSIVVAICVFLFMRLMTSEYGLSMRIFGSGRVITESLGINSNDTLNFGLCISNMMCALAGALIAQITGELQIGIGNGCLVFGFAAIKIGARFIPALNIKSMIASCIAGSFLFESGIRLLTDQGLDFMSGEYRSVILTVTLIFIVSIYKTRQDLTKENV